MIKPFQITRVVTRNIITDSFQSIRNLFGLRLRGYELMISQAIEEVTQLAKELYPEQIWYRIIVNPLGNKSCMIIVYGEYKE
jgi:uncharacterized protein YbjQ (UPF0145 family)